ncbi:hypothetical protein CHR53_23485 [Neobacillus mesonae]|uniref:Uncharacterized protein n=1 Tax=Neobacillus mesonae TaxID=1193713 RepID=A0A3T0I3U2_9BACI|nr:hypothetical protein CHR53_23485 [Neobacillus mesonae]
MKFAAIPALGRNGFLVLCAVWEEFGEINEEFREIIVKVREKNREVGEISSNDREIKRKPVKFSLSISLGEPKLG